MFEIDEGPHGARHERMLAAQAKQRKAEVRGGRRYVAVGLVFMALGAVALLFFLLDGDPLGIALSAAMLVVGAGCAAFGGLVVAYFKKPRPPAPKGAGDGEAASDMPETRRDSAEGKEGRSNG